MCTKTCLPVYFFGENNNQDDNLEKSEFISLGNNTVEDCHLSEPNLSRIQSPTSSLASTKKLEWDSGADIGYNAYNSFKKARRSKSFPSLNMDLSISQINKSDETQGDEISIKKVTHVTTDNLNSPCTSAQAIEREQNFKHSTPIDEKIEKKITEKMNIKKAQSKDECLQTSIVQYTSKCVQTENLNNPDELLLKIETIKSSISSGSSLSKSSSFQYIPGSNISENSTKSGKKNESSTATSTSTRSSKSSEKETDDNSNTSPLAKMISTQQSSNLITDIDKSLHLLQKFIKSENYTPDTKKFYARKIVNKIISSKYIDDSSTSNSNTSISSKNSEPAIEPNIIKSKLNDVQEPERINCSVQCDTIPKESKVKPKKIAEKLEEIIAKSNKITEETKQKNKPNKSDSEVTNKNWKEGETLSEKLFEARKKINSSQGSVNTAGGLKDEDVTKKSSYLIQHSKNERKRQLSWINNEISYLHRLKDLLQKTDTSSVTSVEERKTVKNAEDNKSNLTVSTNNINSSFSDIESRFKQEFGSSTSKSSGHEKELEMAIKLSKYLTNKQLKTLISNNTLHCHCECCKKRQSNENRHNSHDSRFNSFNSHNYKSYNKNESPKSPKHNKREDIVLNSQKSDAGIQCKLNKPTHRRESATFSFDSNFESDHRRNVEIFYKNSQNLNSLSNIFEMEEPARIPAFIHTNEKQRFRPRYKPKRGRKPVAYFLTFEEDSRMEIPRSNERVLQNVKVKVPKSSRNTSRSNDEKRSYTLQEYLMTNRPDFIKSADWRKSMISDLTSRTGQKTKTIFTCSQMKEMTAKKYKNLPEVQSKIYIDKVLQEKQRNRIMQQVFTKKLQKKTLQGELYIATCVNVMDSL